MPTLEGKFPILNKEILHAHFLCRRLFPIGRGSAASRLLGLQVRIPPGTWISVSRNYCVLCRYRPTHGPIPRLEEQVQQWSSTPILSRYKEVKQMVKQSLTRPGQALRFPRGGGYQISRQSAHESGKVESPTHRPPLNPRKYSWYWR